MCAVGPALTKMCRRIWRLIRFAAGTDIDIHAVVSEVALGEYNFNVWHPGLFCVLFVNTYICL